MSRLKPEQQKVVEEKGALDAKMKELASLIFSPDSLYVDARERDWMISQWYAMKAYSRALGERIKTY